MSAEVLGAQYEAPVARHASDEDRSVARYSLRAEIPLFQWLLGVVRTPNLAVCLIAS